LKKFARKGKYITLGLHFSTYAENSTKSRVLSLISQEFEDIFLIRAGKKHPLGRPVVLFEENSVRVFIGCQKGTSVSDFFGAFCLSNSGTREYATRLYECVWDVAVSGHNRYSPAAKQALCEIEACIHREKPEYADIIKPCVRPENYGGLHARVVYAPHR
jgi:hypothetical protein